MKIKINKEQASYINGLETREAKKDFILEHILLSLEESLDRENAEPISFKDGEFHTSDANLALYLIHFPHLFKPKDSGREKFDKFIEDNGLKKFTPPEQKENLLHFDLPKSNPKDSKININDLENGSFIQKTEGTTTFYDSNGPIKLSPESLSKEQLKDITKPKSILYEFEGRKMSEKEFFEEVEKGKKYFEDSLFKEWLEYKPSHLDKVKKYTREDLEEVFNASRADIMGLPIFTDFEDFLYRTKK